MTRKNWRSFSLIWSLSLFGLIAPGCTQVTVSSMPPQSPAPTPIEGASPEPEKSRSSEVAIVSSTDTRFSEQDLSEALFEQVQEINRECGFYDVTSPCSKRSYQFKDVVLTTKRNGTESVENSLVPNQPISQEAALAYFKVVNGGKDAELKRAESDAEKMLYLGCPYDAGAEEPASLCQTELTLTQDEKVSKIVIRFISP